MSGFCANKRSIPFFTAVELNRLPACISEICAIVIPSNDFGKLGKIKSRWLTWYLYKLKANPRVSATIGTLASRRPLLTIKSDLFIGGKFPACFGEDLVFLNVC